MAQVHVALPEGAWDPLGFGGAEDADAEEFELEVTHGDVGMQVSANMMWTQIEWEKQQRIEAAQAEHEFRLEMLESTDRLKQGRSSKKTSSFTWEGSKKFEWRQISHILVGPNYPIDNGVITEVQITAGNVPRVGMVVVEGNCIFPPAVHVGLLCGFINSNLPEPQGARRGGKGDNWHVEISEVVFPTACVLHANKELIEAKSKIKKPEDDFGPVTSVHCVSFNVSKQLGVLEPKPLWGSIKYPDAVEPGPEQKKGKK